ncbi:hypothetical protein BDA96_02G100800 [Sorghum bicolor]|uniref:Ubiquitin-like protease family profile domain-containing protein n=2 Tax=Sorghum bicolor TaxID=4558 RepID=A0A921RLJ6_SORBI|nr:hypothetical protein BDA96_02G100800 [Sorghum bicolor]OQU88795.1 hypothetical protein SORBI_3002G097601 [Sorghum bicolor]
MASLPADGLDDLLFEFYKKEVLKHLITKMTPEMVRTLRRLKDGGPSTSDIGDCKLRLESFLASFVAGEDVHTTTDSEFLLGSLKSRLESMFGSILSKEVISGIVGVFALRCSKMPRMHEEFEKLVVDLMKFLVDSSCIKLDDCDIITPPMKRKYVTSSLLAAPAKRVVPRGNPTEQPFNIDAKVLFPEVQEIPVIEGPSTTCKEPRKDDDDDVIFVKEVTLNDKLNMMSKVSDTLYNKNNVVGSKLDEQIAATAKDGHSPSLSIVIEERVNADAGRVCIPESTRFPLTPRDKMVYNVVLSLGKSKHARSIVVDIGGCNLRYYSLAESMAPGSEVCSYVVNVLCRKYFLDERPTISRKHYFFSSVSDVFLSESTDYSSVQKSFNGAASVLSLHLCDSLHFPVLVGKHWLLFVVDMNRKFFFFLDSQYSKDDDFSISTRKKLIEAFLHAWDLFVGPSTRFDEFMAGYPHVPKQENEADSGIFVIKFMVFWQNGRKLMDLFSHQDIPSVRVQIVNDLLFSKHNIADIKPLKDLIAPNTPLLALMDLFEDVNVPVFIIMFFCSLPHESHLTLNVILKKLAEFITTKVVATIIWRW